MRLKALLADDENAVSPVIGVILMVAITVILAAVIASFVLGLGPSDAAPTVNFDSELEDTSAPSALVIEVTGGDPVPAQQLSFTGIDNSSEQWNNLASTSENADSDIGAGSTAIVEISDGSDYDVSVIWEAEDGGATQTLTSFSG